MGEARNVKFGIRIDVGKCHLTHDKIPANWAWSGSGAELLNFGTACIYLYRLSPYTSCIADKIVVYTATCIHLYPDTCCSSGTGCIWCKRGLREQGLGHVITLKTAAIEALCKIERPLGWEFTR